MDKRLNGWQIVSSPMAKRYDTVGIKRGVDELAGQVGHRKKNNKKTQSMLPDSDDPILLIVVGEDKAVNKRDLTTTGFNDLLCQFPLKLARRWR